MPNINYPIPDIEATVERQVAMSVAKQLCKRMDMDTMPNIVFNGQHDDRPTSGSKDQDNINRNELNGYDYVFITYEEEDTEDAINTNAGYYRPNEMYLFNDDDIGVKVFANYVHTIGRIQFKYQGVDRNMVHQFNNRMRTKYFLQHQVYLIEPEYNYFIPNEVLYYLIVLYSMKQTVIGTTVSQSKYLSQHFIKPIYVKKRSDGQVDKLYKREIQSGVFGNLSPDTKASIDKDGDNSKVTVTYTFEFTYHKPSNIRLVTPIMVAQKTLPKQLRMYNRVYDPDDKPLKTRPSSYENIIYRSIKSINTYDENRRHTMLRSPNWDEWNDPEVKDYMLPLFSVLCQIQQSDKKRIISLDELKTRFIINDNVYQYMESCGRDLLDYNKCAITITVFYNDTRMSKDIFDWDDATNTLYSKSDLELLKIYHIVVSINTNITSDFFDKEKFLKHGASSKIILNTLFPDMSNDDESKHLLNDDGTINKNILDNLLSKYYRSYNCVDKALVSYIKVICSSINNNEE